METFSALLALCAGNSPVTGEFPSQRPVTRSFDVYFDLRLEYGWVNNSEAGDLRRNGDNGLLHDGTKLLPEPNLTCHQLADRKHVSISVDINMIPFDTSITSND